MVNDDATPTRPPVWECYEKRWNDTCANAFRASATSTASARGHSSTSMDFTDAVSMSHGCIHMFFRTSFLSKSSTNARSHGRVTAQNAEGLDFRRALKNSTYVFDAS